MFQVALFRIDTNATRPYVERSLWVTCLTIHYRFPAVLLVSVVLNAKYNLVCVHTDIYNVLVVLSVAIKQSLKLACCRYNVIAFLTLQATLVDIM